MTDGLLLLLGGTGLATVVHLGRRWWRRRRRRPAEIRDMSYRWRVEHAYDRTGDRG